MLVMLLDFARRPLRVAVSRPEPETGPVLITVQA
jgi:hypothetical protein